MVSSSRLLTNAAKDVVEDIGKPYDGYDADLVGTFTRVLQILRDEPSENGQRRAIETLLRGVASKLNAEVVES